MSIPPLKTDKGTLIDYDLNIYHMDDKRILDPNLVDPDPNDDANYIYVYSDTWYIDVYEYLQTNTGNDLQHVTGPFPLTELERRALGLGGEGWDDDSWYGMWGFLKDYDEVITDRLRGILESLPKYVEEVLF